MVGQALYGADAFDWVSHLPYPRKLSNWLTERMKLSYEKSRPAYPPSLFKNLLEYRRAHGSSNDTVLDLGCGSGICTPLLLNCGFSKIICSDVNGRQLKIAESRFSNHPKIASGKIQLIYRQSSAEQLDWIEDRSLDLVIAAEAAHFFDHSRWFSEVARVLKPGGTLAFWNYGTPSATCKVIANRSLLQPRMR